MRKALLSILTLAALASPAAAADWLKLEGITFTSRISVTVDNPNDAPVDAALVHIPLGDLAKLLPDAKPGQIGVVDPTTPPPKRDAADKWFIPSQENAGQLIFSVPLKPHESRQLFIYTAPAKANLPGFPMGTGYDSRHAYRSFENRFAAFRMETGPGSNTTGMSIDLFGKTAAGIGLRLTELYQAGHDSYHDLQYWGVDILKVGNGPGLGGLYLFAGDAMARPVYQTTNVECVYSGPVETLLRVTAPVKLAGKTLLIERNLMLVADDRSIRDEVIIHGDDLSNIQLGLGIRDLPNCTWTEHPEQGVAFMTGDANQPHYKAVGLGCAFNPKAFVRTWELPDKKDFGHVYILKGQLSGNTLTSRHRLTAIWDMDAQLPKPVATSGELIPALSAWCSAYADARDHPITVKLGSSVETAP